MDMDRNLKIGIIAVGALLFLFLAGSLGLHFGQKGHNRIHMDLDTEFPPDKEHVPGEIIATVIAGIMEHELDSTFGWRPNDFFLWGPGLWADNNSNRQMGIMHGVRETMLVFRDNLTKVSSNVYDHNLLEADTMFRNDEKKLFFPSAENRFAKGITYLEHYVEGLHTDPPTSRQLNKRMIELIKLFEAWTALLGDGHANLYREVERDGGPVRAWKTDNYFYTAQGYAHVMFYVMKSIRREYGEDLKGSVEFLFDEVLDALDKAHTMKPLIVIDGSPAGLFANHRRALDSYISEARDKMFSIQEELEK